MGALFRPIAVNEWMIGISCMTTVETPLGLPLLSMIALHTEQGVHLSIISKHCVGNPSMYWLKNIRKHLVVLQYDTNDRNKSRSAVDLI